MRRSGLGKGLGALIPSEGASPAAGAPTSESALQEIPITAIEPNPFQPRTIFDEDTLVALTASIRELGVLQPVLVRPVGDDRYQLIAGERRWRAARRAGLPTLPALVRDADDLASMEQAVVENLHRADLNPLEEASAYQQLIEDFGLTHEQVATRVGRSRSAITNMLRLLQLPPSIQHLVHDGRLSAGHARALLGSPDRAYQEALAKKAVHDGLSVRQVEDAVRARAARGVSPDDEAAAPSRPPALRPPGLLELEELLSAHLETRVKVDMAASRGRVVIDFATLEDLERIYRKVVPEG